MPDLEDEGLDVITPAPIADVVAALEQAVWPYTLRAEEVWPNG